MPFLRAALFAWLVCPALLSAAEPATGTISGTVSYRADKARPWPYGRYYVKDRKTGRLAEAVVALSSPALKSAPGRKPQVSTIDQENFRFVPETISIERGDQVRFTNSDLNSHNVSSDTLLPFDETVEPRGERTVTLDKAGGIRRPAVIGCKLHSGMRAWIYVFDHPFHAATGEEGTFRFENVPPGDYQLQMVHPAGGLQWSRKVQVTAGGELKVEVEVSPDDKFARGG